MNGMYDQVATVEHRYRQPGGEAATETPIWSAIGDALAPFLVVCACWGFVLATCLATLH